MGTPGGSGGVICTLKASFHRGLSSIQALRWATWLPWGGGAPVLPSFLPHNLLGALGQVLFLPLLSSVPPPTAMARVASEARALLPRTFILLRLRGAVVCPESAVLGAGRGPPRRQGAACALAVLCLPPVAPVFLLYDLVDKFFAPRATPSSPLPGALPGGQSQVLGAPGLCGEGGGSQVQICRALGGLASEVPVAGRGLLSALGPPPWP